MICPHCCSPRHNLCAPGFKLEVEMTTLADALNDFSAASLQSNHSHLLGQSGPGGQMLSVSAAAGKAAKSKILVVIPVFADTGLGDYGQAALASRSPEVLYGRKLDLKHFQGEYGQVHMLDFSSQPEPMATSVDILLVGQGENAECDKSRFCGLVGTAIDNGLASRYDQIVIAIADFTQSTVDGRLIGAVARCRLAVAIVEEHADEIVRRLTLIVHDQQVSALCHGIEVAGPLCSSCSHPRAGSLNHSPR